MFVLVDEEGIRGKGEKNKALYHPAWHVLGNKLRQQVRRAGLGFVLFVARLLHPKSLTSVGIAYRSVGLPDPFWGSRPMSHLVEGFKMFKDGIN